MLLLQAATAASMADSINDVPAEGDGFTYEHYKDRQELWFDFIADTGGRRATSAAGVLLSQVPPPPLPPPPVGSLPLHPHPATHT